MGAVGVAPEIVDGALAVVVKEDRSALAVWKGQDRIDIHDLAGTWRQSVVPAGPRAGGSWAREDVIAQAVVSLGEVSVTPAPGPMAEGVQVEPDDLHRSWLVRARRWGYALWDGARSVDVYHADGAHRQRMEVPATDLSSVSHLMLEVLAHTRREDEPGRT
jgi:hypothetical protein